MVARQTHQQETGRLAGWGLPSLSLNRMTSVLVGLLIVVLVGHFLSLTIYPTVFIDESWLANTSWSWLKTGVPFDLIHSGPLDQFGYPWLTDNFIGQAPYTIAYQLIGLGLFQTRLVSWLFSLILVVATIQVGRRLFDLNAGLLAALLLTLSMPYLQSSRQRQDVILAAMIMVSFWLALYALDEDKVWAHFLSGLLLGLGFDVHQTAMIFIPALGALYLLHYRKRLLFARGTWIVGIGGALGLGYYAATHMLPNYEVYSKLMSFYFVSEADARIPLMNPAIILESALRELSRYRFRESPLDLAMIAAGTLALLYRRSKGDQRLLTYTAAAFASFILLSSSKTPLYAINLYPFFMLIVGAGAVAVIRMAQRPLVARIALVVIVALVGFDLVQTAARIYSQRDYDYYAITNRIRDVIPEGERILGMPTWWLGLSEYDYISSLNIAYYRFFNQMNVQQALAEIHPDYIIVDDAQRAVLVDEGQQLLQGMNVYAVSRAEFNAVLESQAELVLQFTDPWQGTLQVYHLTWPQ